MNLSEELQKSADEEEKEVKAENRAGIIILLLALAMLTAGWFWLQWKFQLAAPFSGWFHHMVN